MNGNSDRWQPLASFTGIPEEVRSWLAETGPLTARVRARSESFRLRVLGETQEGAMHRRDIAMYDGDQPLVFARTRVPADTLAAHPWLAELGEQPLGSRMYDEPGFHREAFEVARLVAGNELHDFIRTHIMPLDEPVWARRARVAFFEHGFEITECFLPGLI